MGHLHLATAVACYERGMAFAEDGDLFHALEALDEAVGLQPSYVDARIALGALAIQHGDMARAYTQLEAAVELEPTHAIALGYLGIACFLTGDDDRALDCWARALQDEPGMPVEMTAALGRMLLASGLPERACALLTILVDRVPTSAAAHTVLAATLIALDDLARARLHAEQALALDETWAAAHQLRGDIAFALDDLETARRSFTRARALDPTFLLATAMLARTLQRLGQHEEAMVMVQAVLQDDTLDIDALLTCARACADAGMADTAIGLIQDAMDFAPDDEAAIDLYLDVATQAKDRAALQWLREEIAVGDNDLLRAIAVCERIIAPPPTSRGKKTPGRA
jgi:tetratricopeptide (TPR) repeat protein